MASLAKRLQFVLNDKRLTQEKLSEMADVAQMTISNIVNDVTKKPRDLLRIAGALGVDPNWLQSGVGEYIPKDEHAIPLMQLEKDDDHNVRIDYLDVRLAAGQTGFSGVDYPEIIHSIWFSKSGVMEIVGQSQIKGMYLANVPTDSMEPTITKNDIVFIDTNVKEYIGEGIYAFSIEGDLYIKRLQKVLGVYRAISDNRAHYEPFDISVEIFNTAKIIGKFIRVLPINPRNL